ncbi:hypothetical protein CYMTET_15569, partial [Cymbomonas tetramitiformis]
MDNALPPAADIHATVYPKGAVKVSAAHSGSSVTTVDTAERTSGVVPGDGNELSGHVCSALTVSIGEDMTNDALEPADSASAQPGGRMSVPRHIAGVQSPATYFPGLLSSSQPSPAPHSGAATPERKSSEKPEHIRELSVNIPPEAELEPATSAGSGSAKVLLTLPPDRRAASASVSPGDSPPEGGRAAHPPPPTKGAPVRFARGLSSSESTKTDAEIKQLIHRSVSGESDAWKQLKRFVKAATVKHNIHVADKVSRFVIEKLGGALAGDEPPKPPELIQCPMSARLGVELIPLLPSQSAVEAQGLTAEAGQPPSSPRWALASGIQSAVCACVRSTLSAAEAGVTRALIPVLQACCMESDGKKVAPPELYPLSKLLETLAACSMTVKELDMLLVAAMEPQAKFPLLKALDNGLSLPESKGPSAMFQMNGLTSGLVSVGAGSKWPFANGYGFATWMYVESFAVSAEAEAATRAEAEAAVFTGRASTSPAVAADAARVVLGAEESHMPRLFRCLAWPPLVALGVPAAAVAGSRG